MTRYLLLSGPQKNNGIYNRIRYPINQSHSITYIFCHNYAIIKIDSYASLSLGKTLILDNVVILTKSFFNKSQIQYQYNTFLEKGSYQ